MKTAPMDSAVEKLLSDAQAGAGLVRFRRRIEELTSHDFADLAALLDLLAEHPKLADDEVLAGAVSAIQRQFVRLWDDCEAAGGV